MTAAQMRGLADVARDLGDGDIRLTVWQNLIISGVPTGKSRGGAERGSRRSALAIEANSIRAGLVACTGNAGCKFAASDTKRHAEEIARWCESARRARRAGEHPSHRLPSLLRAALLSATSACSPARCRPTEDGDAVEGYHIHVGGGFGPDAALAPRDSIATSRPKTRRAPSSACSRPILRTAPRREESFLAFARRHDIEALKIADRARGGRMSMPPRPPFPSLIPESAPFTAEQRDLAGRPVRRAALARTRRHAAVAANKPRRCCRACSTFRRHRPATAEDDDGAPWHDPAMPLAERMKLAESRPLRRRMMAAMGQQDCGQCGYNCQDYSDAIFSAKGKAAESLRTGRQGNAPHAQDALSGARPTPAASKPPRCRPRPHRCRCYGCAGRGAGLLARLSGRRRFSCRARGLNKPGSEKETWHVELDLSATGIDYVVGDCLRRVPDQRSRLSSMR